MVHHKAEYKLLLENDILKSFLLQTSDTSMFYKQCSYSMQHKLLYYIQSNEI